MKLAKPEKYLGGRLFGLQVYDDIIVVASAAPLVIYWCWYERREGTGGVEAGISNRLSKLSSDETAIRGPRGVPMGSRPRTNQLLNKDKNKDYQEMGGLGW
jgi:hypothetical protein